MLLVGGQFVSRAGDALLSLASVWLVLELSGNNPLVSGVALAFEFLPALLFGLLAGALVDRWDRRRTMIVADLLRGVFLPVIPLLYAAGALHVWHIVALGFALSSLGRLFNPARQAILPDLVPADRLTRANAIFEGANQAAWIIGPALGGVLIALIGAANVFYLDAASFLVSVLSIALIPVRHTARPAGGRLWSEALGGLRHVRATPILAAAWLLSVATTFSFAPVPALLPVLVRGEFGAGARVYGAVMACFFVGAVVGSLVVARRGAGLHRGRALLAGILGVGVLTLALAIAPTVVAAGVVLALLGAITSAFNVADYTLIQQQTPAELRGRVFAFANMASSSFRPASLLLAGAIARVYGVRFSLGLLALVALIAGLGAIRGRALRETR